MSQFTAYLILMIFSSIPNTNPKIHISDNFMNAIAFVESSFDNCAHRGQYNGRFQQGKVFSVDLGYVSSHHVLCDRVAAERDFRAYQAKYAYLTKGEELWMLVLHSRGPGTVKKQRIPWVYLWRYVDARVRINNGTLKVR